MTNLAKTRNSSALIALASMVVYAASIREASFIQDNRSAAPAGNDAKPGHYAISIEDACLKACEGSRDAARPIQIMLTTAWNDSLEWAKKVVADDDSIVVEEFYKVLDELFDSADELMKKAFASKLN